MKGLSLEEFNQDYASKCVDLAIIPKHAVLINVNEKNITNENPAKKKKSTIRYQWTYKWK